MKLISYVLAFLLPWATQACAQEERSSFAFTHVCQSARSPSDANWRLVFAADFAPPLSRDKATLWVCFKEACDPVVMMNEQAPFVAEWTDEGDIELRTMNVTLVLNDRMTNSGWRGALRVRAFDGSDRTQIHFVDTLTRPGAGVGDHYACHQSSSIADG